jgi:hypothetical protein
MTGPGKYKALNQEGKRSKKKVFFYEMSGGLSLVVKLSCSMLLLIQSFNSESDV